jgi:hypothetical protein
MRPRTWEKWANVILVVGPVVDLTDAFFIAFMFWTIGALAQGAMLDLADFSHIFLLPHALTHEADFANGHSASRETTREIHMVKSEGRLLDDSARNSAVSRDAKKKKQIYPLRGSISYTQQYSFMGTSEQE